MICEKCGVEFTTPPDWPFCPHGKVGNYTNFRDEYPGGITLENYGAQPVTFYSESERRAYMRANGLEMRERYVPLPGTDRDPAGVCDPRKYQDAKTLENGAILMLRAAGVKQETFDPVTSGVFRPFETQTVNASVGSRGQRRRARRKLRRMTEKDYVER